VKVYVSELIDYDEAARNRERIKELQKREGSERELYLEKKNTNKNKAGENWKK